MDDLTKRCSLATVCSVPLVAFAMWWSRRGWLADGPSCASAGPYDCAYDPTLAAVYGGGIGVLFAIVALSVWVLSARLPGWLLMGCDSR